MTQEEKDELRNSTDDAIFDAAMECGLNEREKDFVLLYLETYQLRASYQKVYGCALKTASTDARKSLARPKMQKFMAKVKDILNINYDLSPSRYIEFLLEAANADISEYLTFKEEEVEVRNKEGELMLDLDTGEPVKRKTSKISLKNSEECDTKFISRISQGRDGVKLEMIDKLKCWDRLREFFGWEKEARSADISSSNIIEAINNSAKSAWGDDADNDLNETLGTK